MVLHSQELILHSGVLFKKRTPLIGPKKWKPRYFVLTSSKLKYYTFQNGKLRGEIDFAHCRPDALEVMPEDARKPGKSSATIWRIALTGVEGRWLMAASTEREMNDWIAKIGGTLRSHCAKKLRNGLAPSSSSSALVEKSLVHDPFKRTSLAKPIYRRQASLPSKLNELDMVESIKSAPTARTDLDFQNFVAQPRRTVVFPRRLAKGKASTEPGVFRHSTGHLEDDFELARDLEELRRGASFTYREYDDEGDNASDNGQDDDDEEDQEQLLKALRAFAETEKSGLNAALLDDDDDDFTPRPSTVEDNNVTSTRSACGNENLTPRPSTVGDINVPRTTPVRKPIYHYSKPESPPKQPIEEPEKWYSALRRSHRRRPQCAVAQAVFPDEEETKEDDQPRRYSTGSMVFTDECPIESTEELEKEEKLIQELLHGFVDEKSPSQDPITTRESVETDGKCSSQTASSFSSTASSLKSSSSSPTLNAVARESSRSNSAAKKDEMKDERWYKRWRIRKDRLAQTEEQSDISPRAIPARVPYSRRYSTGSTMPNNFTQVDQAPAPASTPVLATQLSTSTDSSIPMSYSSIGHSDEREFVGKWAQSQAQHKRRVELREMALADDDNDSLEEQEIVVVVRRRHSYGAESSPHSGSKKRVKMRVFVEMDDGDGAPPSPAVTPPVGSTSLALRQRRHRGWRRLFRGSGSREIPHSTPQHDARVCAA
ncbi:hypothetical protein Poli38472_012261 [Pythium oligandrum]|uniref:PH domain-containing protein n=1 Tax=Pythium oligandrum TaxID=41045 RepID=A0A8K1CR07_PYTOL|nr:hypothetical protein Poli38472_012261 [Pythium oligandrum]|eukprot:TMW67145.1 hypothetical protein Poli38472_012261 [Pythium oligandrum]